MKDLLANLMTFQEPHTSEISLSPSSEISLLELELVKECMFVTINGTFAFLLPTLHLKGPV